MFDYTIMIPRNIFQTSKNKLGKHVKDWIIKHTETEWKYVHHDDNENIDFLKTHFQKDYPDVIEKYNTLPFGQFKADFARYAYLYINGGVYLDSDIVLNETLENIIEDFDFVIVHSIKWNCKLSLNAFIAVHPGNQTILKCFQYIYNVSSKRHAKDHYLTLCRQLYTQVEHDYKVELRMDQGIIKSNGYRIKKLQEKRRYARDSQLKHDWVVSDIYDVNRNKVVLIHIGGGHTPGDLQKIVDTIDK